MDETNPRRLSYCKLKSGNWGVRGLHLQPGEVVTLRRKDGREIPHRVGKVFWSNNEGMMMAEIADNRPICPTCGQTMPER